MADVFIVWRGERLVILNSFAGIHLPDIRIAREKLFLVFLAAILTRVLFIIELGAD